MKKQILAMTAAAVAMSPGAVIAQRYHGDWGRVRGYDYNNPEPGYSPYYADRYYRAGHYQERVLGPGDRIYRGRDGRYYCRRSDGSTGLIVGAAIGGLLGNQLRVGGSRTLGTILGGAAGAALGSSVDRHQIRCR